MVEGQEAGGWELDRLRVVELRLDNVGGSTARGSWIRVELVEEARKNDLWLDGLWLDFFQHLCVLVTLAHLHDLAVLAADLGRDLLLVLCL